MVVLLLVLALLTAPAIAHDEAAAHCGGGGVNNGNSQVPPPPDDLDCDFAKDDVDNCPPLGVDDIRTRNPGQEDTDGDGVGDWCQADDDGDGVFDWTDHKIEYESTRVQLDVCRTVVDPLQKDDDHNGVGNECEVDNDQDGLFDSRDNCPSEPNPDQADLEGDDFGDVCDNDDDGDYTRDSTDNCPRFPNPDQLDDDKDGIGAACDDNDIPAPAATPTPTPSATVSVTDRQPPRVTVSVRTSHRVAEVGDGLIVRVRCSEACTAKAELKVSKAVARSLRLRGTTVVATGTARTEGATSTYAFVRFNSRIRTRLFRRSRTVLTLSIAATDPAGNTRRETEPLVLKIR